MEHLQFMVNIKTIQNIYEAPQRKMKIKLEMFHFTLHVFFCRRQKNGIKRVNKKCIKLVWYQNTAHMYNKCRVKGHVTQTLKHETYGGKSTLLF